jgi:hypothetical protein
MSKAWSVKNNTETVISLGRMHPGQIRAYWALQPYRYKILRCGRRFWQDRICQDLDRSRSPAGLGMRMACTPT